MYNLNYMNYEREMLTERCFHRDCDGIMFLHIVVAKPWETVRFPLGVTMVGNIEVKIRSAHMKCASCGFTLLMYSLRSH